MLPCRVYAKIPFGIIVLYRCHVVFVLSDVQQTQLPVDSLVCGYLLWFFFLRVEIKESVTVQ